VNTWFIKKTSGEGNHLPYWRTLKADGFLNEKYPGGAERNKKLLVEEGFKISPGKKRYLVADFQKYLFTP
jgi:alkylated DNA nucleotide flippase Atl1